jgi:hypothetical protein
MRHEDVEYVAARVAAFKAEIPPFPADMYHVSGAVAVLLLVSALWRWGEGAGSSRGLLRCTSAVWMTPPLCRTCRGAASS